MTRVYESNGPEIKIRGTASHLAEKYVQLARDAQGSGDPVAAENYYQHAEHYFRIIAAAQEQFRQNQPQQFQQRPDGEIREDVGDETDGEYSSFGAEPGFAPQPQPQQPSLYTARAAVSARASRSARIVRSRSRSRKCSRTTATSTACLRSLPAGSRRSSRAATTITATATIAVTASSIAAAAVIRDRARKVHRRLAISAARDRLGTSTPSASAIRSSRERDRFAAHSFARTLAIADAKHRRSGTA